MTQQHTILIVDDEPHIAAVVAAKLRRCGLRVVTAADGRDALSVLRTEAVDLVISDVRMPDTDGVALVRAMASDARTAHIPVLIITGLGHDLDDEAMLGPRVVGVLRKPFSPRELAAFVQRALPAHPANRAA